MRQKVYAYAQILFPRLNISKWVSYNYNPTRP